MNSSNDNIDKVTAPKTQRIHHNNHRPNEVTSTTDVVNGSSFTTFEVKPHRMNQRNNNPSRGNYHHPPYKKRVSLWIPTLIALGFTIATFIMVVATFFKIS